MILVNQNMLGVGNQQVKCFLYLFNKCFMGQSRGTPNSVRPFVWLTVCLSNLPLCTEGDIISRANYITGVNEPILVLL